MLGRGGKVDEVVLLTGVGRFFGRKVGGGGGGGEVVAKPTGGCRQVSRRWGAATCEVRTKSEFYASAELHVADLKWDLCVFNLSETKLQSQDKVWILRIRTCELQVASFKMQPQVILFNGICEF